MSYYRRVDSRICLDAKYLSLSTSPSARLLWHHLLVGPHHEGMPGLHHATREGMASLLGWSLKDFDRCWAELEAAGMAKADWSLFVIYLPNALRHHPPNSYKNVIGWGPLFDRTPDCALKRQWYESLLELLQLRGWDAPPYAPCDAPCHAPTDAEYESESEYELELELESESCRAEIGSTALDRSRAWDESWELWRANFSRSWEALGGHPLEAPYFLDQWVAGVEEHYSRTRGSFTSKRKSDVAARLAKFEPAVVMLAIEKAHDGYFGTRDERYAVGICRSLKLLSDKEFNEEYRRHRSRNKGRGVAYEFSQAMQEAK